MSKSYSQREIEPLPSLYQQAMANDVVVPAHHQGR